MMFAICGAGCDGASLKLLPVGSRVLGVALAFTIVGVVLAGHPAVAQSVPPEVAAALERLKTVDAELTRITTTIMGTAGGASVPVYEQRFVDARAQFDRGGFENAAILLRDIVGTPEFKTAPHYDDAVYLLGLCLEKSGFYEAARKRYQQLIDKRSDKTPLAKARMIEITLNVNDNVALAEWTQRSVDPNAQDTVPLRYGIGKAHHRLGNTDAAVRWLSAVPKTVSDFVGAQYYLGVIATAREDYSAARTYFETAANFPITDGAATIEKQSAVLAQDHALLALGRLYFESGNDVEAIRHYERIPKASPTKNAAYYELATIYSDTGQDKKALQTLDLLELTTADDQGLVEAGVLRGDVLAKLGRYEDAVAAYEAAVRRMNGIHADLLRLSGSAADADEYFRWLVADSRSGYGQEPPVSEATVGFFMSRGGGGRIERMLADLGEQRRELALAVALSDDLQATLAVPFRLDLYPNFAEAWMDLGAVDATLLSVYGGLLDAEGSHAERAAAEGQRDLLKQLGQDRKTLYQQYVAEVPQTADGFRARQTASEKQLAELNHQHLSVINSVNNNGRKDSGAGEPSESETGGGEDKNLANESGVDAVRKLTREIAITSVQAAGNAVVDAGDRVLRDRLWRACVAEDELLRKIRSEKAQEYRTLVDSYADMRTMVAERLETAGATQKSMVEKTKKRVAELASELTREKERLTVATTTVEQQVQMALEMARTQAKTMFQDAVAKAESLMLVADLGLVDVIWQQKQQRSDRVRKLAETRADRLREIDRSLRDLEAETLELTGDKPPVVEGTPLNGSESGSGRTETELPDATQD